MGSNKWSVVARPVDLRLRERFTIARETWDVAHNVFVTVGYDGLSAVGEASPDPFWGESVESVIAQIEGVDLARLNGPFDLEALSDLLPPGSARAALDIALHDLAGRRAGLSVSELLGLGGRPLHPTSVTIPIAEPDRMVERARFLEGHPILKLKVGFDRDVEIVRAIRGVFDGRIRVDANEGWDEEQAISRLQELADFDVELCEQPVASGNVPALARVRSASPIPVFADEDVCDAADVAALARAVDGVNLKLRKAGGIRELVRCAAVARAHGMRVMIGCDLESGVAATAGAHVAPLADFVDLDGPLLLAEDPYPGVGYDHGRLIVPSGAGLGVERGDLE